MISIEAFPIHIISNLPDDKAEVSSPSSKGRVASFAGVFTSSTSVKPSHQPESREMKEIGGFEKDKIGSAQALSEQSAAENLVGVSENLIPHSNAQFQMLSESSQESLSQNHILFAQNTGIYLEKNIPSPLIDSLSQLGLTHEEIDSFTGAKDLGYLKELLLKLGLNLSEAEQFVRGNPNALKGEEEIFIFNKLINALEQKGILPRQSGGIGEMLAGLKMELLQADRLLVVEGQPQHGIKELLLQLGVHPKDIDKLAALWDHSDKKMSIKQLVTLYFQADDGKELSHLSGKDESSTSSNSKSQNSQGLVDLSGRGQNDINSIVSREIEGGKAQIDFEQVMSKMETKESTAQKVMEQIVKGAKIQVEGGQTRAKISLQPPTLGKLDMYIITKGNQVRATFFTETPQVKEIIESNLPQLRQSFLQQGLKVEHFNVFVGYQPSGNQTEQRSLFDSIKSHRLEREGLDGGDSLTIEKTIKKAMGNHIVDLFV